MVEIFVIVLFFHWYSCTAYHWGIIGALYPRVSGWDQEVCFSPLLCFCLLAVLRKCFRDAWSEVFQPYCSTSLLALKKMGLRNTGTSMTIVVRIGQFSSWPTFMCMGTPPWKWLCVIFLHCGKVHKYQSWIFRQVYCSENEWFQARKLRVLQWLH